MNEKRALKQLKFMQKNSKDMRLAAESWKNDYETLISIILSARTRDEVTIVVAEKLFKIFPNAEKLAKAPLREVQKIIKPINFYKNKSKNIVNCAKILVSKYNGKVPPDFDQLLELPGVGRKTANVFLKEKGKDNLAVDTHVFYLSKKLGWAKSNRPHKVEQELKELFSKKHWSVINETLVTFGKTHTSRKQKDELLKKIKQIR